MLERVRDQLQRSQMISRGDLVIVSVSGGPDSVALLHLLAQLAPEWDLRLHLFHLDHGLRGADSAADARYTALLAEQLAIPATIRTLPPGELKQMPGSLQANARLRRYQELKALAAQIGASTVATGHTADDQAETVLMRLLRGAGTKGLAGIPPVRTEAGLTLIRPLLGISRNEIEQYCVEHKLFPRFDASNAKTDYLRNRIRLHLLPLLAREYNPGIRAGLSQVAAVLREEEELLEQLAADALQRCLIQEPSYGSGGGEPPSATLDGPLLLAEPLAIGRRVVRLVARSLCGPDVDLGLEAVTRVLEAAARTSGTHRLDLPGGLRLTVAYGRCRLEAEAPPDQGEATGVWSVLLQGETVIPELAVRLQAEMLESGEAWNTRDRAQAVFDLERLPGPLTLRYRRPGDRIWPVGMVGSKKVQDILVDAKVPRPDRTRIPLLAAGTEVIWIPGLRLDRRFLATSETPKPLRVRFVQEAPL